MSSVIELCDTRRALEVRAIYISEEIARSLAESGLPDNPKDFVELESLDELAEFHDFVRQVLDGSWVSHVLEIPDADAYVAGVSRDALSSLRAKACKEFEYIRTPDGVVPAIKIIHCAGDEAYHDEALAKAREFLQKIADSFGIPALLEVARV